MSFHRSGPSGAVAISYSTNTMALTPSRRYSSGNSSASTSTISSTSNATKYFSYRSPDPIDRINHCVTASNYRLSSRRTQYSPARSVSSYSDVGSVTFATINLPQTYSSTSTSSASSTTSSSTSSNPRERNGISSLNHSEFYAKYSPSTYIPNINGSSGSLSTSSSSSTLNGHCRSSFTPSLSRTSLAELHGGDERDKFLYDRRSINRQIKRRNNPINTVLTGHDQVDSAAAPDEVKPQQKQQHEENFVANDVNRIIDNDNNNGYDNGCNLEDIEVVRIENYDAINDRDNDNQSLHNYSMLADGTQKYSATLSSISPLSTYPTASPSSVSNSMNSPTIQFFDSVILPSNGNLSASTTSATTITTSTITVTTTTDATNPTSAISDIVSFGASTSDRRALSWIITPTNINNTNLLTNNNTCDELGIINKTVSNKLSSSMINAARWRVGNVDVDYQSDQKDNDADADTELLKSKDSISKNDVNLANDLHSVKHPITISHNEIETKHDVFLDENVRLISKPADNHGNEPSKPSTSRTTTLLNWNDSLNGDSFNASTSTNTSTVPVGVHQAIFRDINDQVCAWTLAALSIIFVFLLGLLTPLKTSHSKSSPRVSTQYCTRNSCSLVPRVIREKPLAVGVKDESSTSRSSRNRIYSRKDGSYGLNGLRNIGNTCFMNSVIQCLSNTEPLLEYLLTEKYLDDINTTTSSMKGALIKAFAQVIHELWESSGERVVNTTSLKSQIQRFAPRFMGYAQQDAQEFLRYLLEGLHEDVNRVSVKPQPILTEIPDNCSESVKAAESWKRYLHSEDSTIVDVFVGQLRSSLTCTSCDHVSVTLDPFWDLSLPIPARSGTVKLNQCLEHFTKVETLDGDEKPTCSKCQMRTKCTKSFSIQKFPRILVIHLKRFSPTERFRAKLSVLVDFPLISLDLSAFAAPGVRGCTYNLYGVANHSGTPYSGHYTAYCKHPYSNEWHEYNDSRVSSVSTSSVVSGEAYVLFYEQQPLNHHL